MIAPSLLDSCSRLNIKSWGSGSSKRQTSSRSDSRPREIRRCGSSSLEAAMASSVAASLAIRMLNYNSSDRNSTGTTGFSLFLTMQICSVRRISLFPSVQSNLCGDPAKQYSHPQLLRPMKQHALPAPSPEHPTFMPNISIGFLHLM